MGAVLTATSAPLRTSPVRRGDYVLRRVLGTPVPPPPADAGSIPADDVRADGLTVRDRLDAHRRNASCVNCHSRIDPLGFALEHFDALGRWRETYGDGQLIEPSGVLSDGAEVVGWNGLRGYLEQEKGTVSSDVLHQTLELCVGAFGIAFRPVAYRTDDETNGRRRPLRVSRRTDRDQQAVS